MVNRISYQENTKFPGTKLTYIKDTKIQKGQRIALFRCDCGNFKEINITSAKRLDSTSCGCYLSKLASERNKTHGLSKTPEYETWSGIKNRIFNSNDRVYHMYGGRGLCMSMEWRESFETFLSDMGPRPSKYHSIERRDNNRGYEKDNCYWATPLEQTRNRSNTLMVTFNGIRKPLADFCDDYKIAYHTVRARLKYGATLENALTIPVRGKECHLPT